MSRITPLLLALGLVVVSLISGVAIAANAAGQAATSAQAADRARVAAMMAGDAAALGAVLSDGLRFVHSDGRVESKSDYVKNLRAGDTAYADVRTSEVETLPVSGDVVTILGMQQMRKRLGADWSEVKLRYLAVYRKERDGWRMIAWQSARPSGSSVVPGK
jgi:ketosteroid isomerase-like protein